MLGHRKVVIALCLLTTLEHILPAASQNLGRPRPQTMAGGGAPAGGHGFAGDALRGGGGFGGNTPGGGGGFRGNPPEGGGGFRGNTPGGGGGGMSGGGGGGGRPYDSNSAEKGRNVLTEGLNLPLIWKSPVAVQAPALMLLTVVLIMFTTIARDSLNVLLEDKRPLGPSSGAGRRGGSGTPFFGEAPEYDNFITPVLDATSDSKFW